MEQRKKIEDVWFEYRSGIKAFLHTRVSAAEEVDDLLQEILIKTHKSLPVLKSEKNIKSWLFTIANHTIIDFYRKRANDQDINASDLWYDREDHTAQQALAECVEPFIKALPEDISELLLQIDLKGRSQKEYAESIGISYSTLKSRVQKGRRQLRGLLESCCHLTLDQHGAIIDFDPKPRACEKC